MRDRAIHKMFTVESIERLAFSQLKAISIAATRRGYM